MARRIVARCDSAPGVVEPVVGDGQGVGHFGRVEEVLRVEVGEGGHRLQLLPQPVGIAAIAVQAVHQGQRVAALHHAAAGGQQPQAVGQHVARQGRGEPSASAAQLLVPFAEHRIVGRIGNPSYVAGQAAAKLLEALLIDQQPGVPRASLA